jgi:hypothetical protein
MLVSVQTISEHTHAVFFADSTRQTGRSSCVIREAFDSRNRFLKALVYLSTPEEEVRSRPKYS